MKSENILTVIEELGCLLDKYKNDIKFKEYEIEKLKTKINQVEEYQEYYLNKNKK